MSLLKIKNHLLKNLNKFYARAKSDRAASLEKKKSILLRITLFIQELSS